MQMVSLMEDIKAALEATDFGIGDVEVRTAYSENVPKYPCIIIEEVENRPARFGSVTGELETRLVYALHCHGVPVLVDGVRYGAYEVARMLLAKSVEVLDELKLTRTTLNAQVTNKSIVVSARFECVLTSDGYIYRIR
jgi:hypothetical protein